MPRSDDSISEDISRRIHAGDAMEKLDQRPPTKVRRGGGGPWRMHVSRQLQAGVPSFAEHAASYRARGEAHKAQDAIDGAAATGRHRAGEPAFGPSQRQLEVARVRNLAVVFDRQNPISDASFLESHASAIAPSLPEHTAEGLMSLLRVARQVGRMHSARAKLRHQDAQRAIVAYAQGAGRSAMRRATERLPALQQFQLSLHARPVPQSWGSVSVMKLTPPSATIAQDALTVDASPGIKYKGFTLGAALDAYWISRHRPTTERGALASGFVVCRLRGRPRSTFFDVGSDTDDGALGTCYEGTFAFWHVASMMFSPYQATFQEMKCDAFENDPDPPADEEVALQAARMR